MDGTRFDTVTRGFAAGTTRRRALAAIAGGAAAAFAGLAGSAEDVSARRCRRRGETCRQSNRCCGYPDRIRCDENSSRRCVRCRPPGAEVPADEFGSCDAQLCCSFACRPTQGGGVCTDV